MSRRLQNEDFKTEADLVGAGGSASQLLNDTKVYVTALSINKTLDDAITDGDIGGGGGYTSQRLTDTVLTNVQTIGSFNDTIVAITPASDLVAAASILGNGSSHGQKALIINKSSSFTIELITTGNMTLNAASAVLAQNKFVYMMWDNTDSMWYQIGGSNA